MPSTDLDIEATILSQKLRNGLWRAIIAAGLAGGVALALWWWVGGSGPTVQTYITTPARIADVTVVVTATGTVEPTNSVGISSALSGTVQSVEVDFNDIVTQGQVLARLDTDKLEATLEHARATLMATEARLALANATLEEAGQSYERALQLVDRGVTTQEVFQAALAANRRVNEANLADACICSPIDGIVLDRSIDVGQIVVSSFSAPVLFTLAEDLDQMELSVDIDEADIGTVMPQDAASFTVEAFADRSFAARITQLRYAPQTIDGVVTYEAILSLDNGEGLLRPGMTAVAEIVVEQVRDALVVPNAALRFTPQSEEDASGGSGLLGMLIPRPPSSAPASARDTAGDTRTIWVLRNGAAMAVEIGLGPSDGMVTVVASGDLAPGDAVITDTATEQ